MLRELAGFSQQQLATLCGFSQSSEVSQLESGKRALTGGIAQDKLASGFGVGRDHMADYLDGDIPAEEMIRLMTPGLVHLKPAWERTELRDQDARPTLHLLYKTGADSEFISGFVHRVNHVGGPKGRSGWRRYARGQLEQWTQVQARGGYPPLDEWLRSRRPPIRKVIAEAMRQLYPPGIPTIDPWESLYMRLVGLHSAWMRRGSPIAPEPTADELVHALEDAS